MSFMKSAGTAVGKGAAYAIEGTRLGTSAFAQGTREGYTMTSAELRAKREALAATAPAVTRRSLKVSTA